MMMVSLLTTVAADPQGSAAGDVDMGMVMDYDTDMNHLPSGNGSTNTTSSRSRRLYHVDVTETGEPCARNELLDRVVDPATYEFGCRDIEYMLIGPKTLVGSGSVRDVWLVEYKGRSVVVKTLRHMEDQRHRDMHTREMLTMDALRQERNVIGMLGVCQTTVVTEYYSTKLLHYVWRHGKNLAIEELVDMSIDAAQGLQALHEIAGGLHIDLKPMQLLVDEEGRVKLNDFNSVHILSINPANGKFCPAQASKRNRREPWPPRMKVPEWLPTKEGKDFKYTVSLVNGVYQMHKQEEEATNELIRTFESRDDDVFVCTYCKSGTTWVQQIITLLLNKGEQGDKNYTQVVPWMESLLFGRKASGDGGERPNDREAQGWTLEAIKSSPNRRFLKSHANLKQLPVGTAKGLKVIYVARNPKDVSISLYHHARNKQSDAFVGDESYMISCFVKGRCENGSWFNHVLEWWEAACADPEHVLFLHYEAMLSEPEAHIRKIAEFAGIEHTDETVAKTVAATSIDAMKRNPKANLMAGEQHIRKGGAGGWRDVYTVRESEAFDEIYLKEMEGTGLKMDFGEGLVMP
eukprot:g12273.t1